MKNKIEIEVRDGPKTGDPDEILMYLNNKCVFHLERMDCNLIWARCYGSKKDLSMWFWAGGNKINSRVEWEPA